MKNCQKSKEIIISFTEFSQKEKEEKKILLKYLILLESYIFITNFYEKNNLINKKNYFVFLCKVVFIY